MPVEKKRTDPTNVHDNEQQYIFRKFQFYLWNNNHPSEQETYSFLPWRANVLHMKANVLSTTNLSLKGIVNLIN